MSSNAVTTNDPSIFDTRRIIPVDDMLMRNHVGEMHFAGIRRKDLVLVTRRIAPRSGEARDLNRVYNTLRPGRKTYVSHDESKWSRSLGLVEIRPEDTRRLRVEDDSYATPAIDHYTVSSINEQKHLVNDFGFNF
jgi:hypothetical protein